MVFVEPVLARECPRGLLKKLGPVGIPAPSSSRLGIQVDMDVLDPTYRRCWRIGDRVVTDKWGRDGRQTLHRAAAVKG